MKNHYSIYSWYRLYHLYYIAAVLLPIIQINREHLASVYWLQGAPSLMTSSKGPPGDVDDKMARIVANMSNLSVTSCHQHFLSPTSGNNIDRITLRCPILNGFHVHNLSTPWSIDFGTYLVLFLWFFKLTFCECKSICVRHLNEERVLWNIKSRFLSFAWVRFSFFNSPKKNAY